MESLSAEDRRAKEILTRAGVRFELVDLSEGRGGRKLAAWFRGVKRTPTLWVGTGSYRKYEGIRAISE